MTPLSPPNFDRLARPYRVLEYLTFGPALQRTRLHFLPELTTCRRALILGDGDGRFTSAVLAANPHLEAQAVDTSPAMLRLLTARAHAAHPTAAARLQTQAVDALTLGLPPHQTYDLIATHFFLDCFTQPDVTRLCASLRPHLAPGAAWVLSDFRLPTGLLRLPARLLIRALYLAFRVATGMRTTRLPDHAAALTAIGLTRTAHRYALGGLLTSELWHLNSQTSPPRSPRPAPRTPPAHGSTLAPMLPPQRPRSADPADPVPNPEPASPSLPEPDPGVFHHDPVPHHPDPPPEPTR